MQLTESERGTLRDGSPRAWSSPLVASLGLPVLKPTPDLHWCFCAVIRFLDDHFNEDKWAGLITGHLLSEVRGSLATLVLSDRR